MNTWQESPPALGQPGSTLLPVEMTLKNPTNELQNVNLLLPLLWLPLPPTSLPLSLSHTSHNISLSKLKILYWAALGFLYTHEACGLACQGNVGSP